MNEPDAVTLVINGSAKRFDSGTHPRSAQQLVDLLGLGSVVLELNGSIVARADWPSASLVDGDRVELVGFVGGG